MTVETYIKWKKPLHTTMCAALLYPNGDIEECKFGHLKAMIADVGEYAWDLIPQEESPLFFMTAYTGVVLIDYENQIYSEQLTKEQEAALDAMYAEGVLVRHLCDIKNGNRFLGIKKKSKE